ncbi:MAG: site-specific DNA-methyltransferase [Candidatus Helarchaeota archaeon]|nr:site-specific DNA-methyltransferase [Candidatus Helarchaeota archaeon]
MNANINRITDFLEIKNQKIYFKSSENMSEIGDNSIHLIVTSPPYGSIKDYGIKDQIGFMDGFDNYIQRLTNVWKECYRVLEPQCRLVVNVGDQYLRKTEHERYRIFSIHSSIIEECLKIGFDFLGDIIWQKISTTNTTGGCSLMGSIYYPRNGLLTYDYEHILIFKKWSGKTRRINDSRKELSKICLDEWKNWYNGHWTFPGIQQKEHIAMFPEELPYRIIRMFSYIGDTVLDPFVGSGTTLKMARQLKRKGIGYEINKNFKPIIENKLNSKRVENKRRDFHNLLIFLWKNEKLNNLKFNFNLARRKGYTVISSPDIKKHIAIDLLISDRTSDDTELVGLLEKKINENNIQNFLKSTLNDGKTKIDNFIVILTYESENFDKILSEYNKKYSNKLLFIRWENFYNNSSLIEEMFSENQIILEKVIRKSGSLDKYF